MRFAGQPAITAAASRQAFDNDLPAASQSVQQATHERNDDRVMTSQQGKMGAYRWRLQAPPKRLGRPWEG